MSPGRGDGQKAWPGLGRIKRGSTQGGPLPALTEAEFLGELGALGLDDLTFDEDDYRLKLVDHTQWELTKKQLSDVDHPMLRHRLAALGIRGGLFPEPGKQRIWVVVFDRLGSLARETTPLHELGHIAAGHHFREKYVLGGDFDPRGEQLVHVVEPGRRLARREPPHESCGLSRSKVIELCEEEADLRAHLAYKFGSLGPRASDSNDFGSCIL